MVDFRYGPVELYLVGFEGERPSPGVFSALADLIEGGLVRLLDLVIISKSENGDLDIVEIEDEDDNFGLGDLELAALGLAGSEDIEEFAELIPPGASAVLLALELLYARHLASKVAASGGVVLRTERIPAPIVNAIIDAEEQEEE
jgi:hypothetical protein